MNINILLTALPTGVKAITKANDDGTYTIALDVNLSKEQAMKELLHELKHIKRNDFSIAAQADLIESMVREANFIPEFEDINFYCHVI